MKIQPKKDGKISCSAHERLSAPEAVAACSDRQFGLVFAGVCAVVGMYPVLYGNSPRWFIAIASVLFLSFSFIAPHKLHLLNVLWAKFGMFIGEIMKPLILGILFYVVFTPFGFIKRKCGASATFKKYFEPESSTYWIERVPHGPASNSYDTQF